jgi:hypothetical protein
VEDAALELDLFVNLPLDQHIKWRLEEVFQREIDLEECNRVANKGFWPN